MHKLGLILVFILFTFSVKAQEGSLFDFQLEKIEGANYLFHLQLVENTNVQYIQIHFLDNGNLLRMDEASLNKKEDGKYYLFFDNEEKEVFLDNMDLSLSYDFGLLKKPSILVKLIDKDFKPIDSYQKITD